MDEIMEKPLPFICEQVEQRWEHWYPKKIKWLRLLRFLGFRRKVIISIGVQERAEINNKTLEPDGELTAFWHYDAKGWEPVDVKKVHIGSPDDDTALVTYGFVETCLYAVDKSRQIAVVSWHYMIEGMGSQDRAYTVTTEYRISETDGHLNFIVNNIKKSKEKLGYYEGDYE
jgi:hypothetical protein